MRPNYSGMAIVALALTGSSIAQSSGTVTGSSTAQSNGTMTPQGCFSANIGGIIKTNVTSMSWSDCDTFCFKYKAVLMAMQNENCYCGTEMPPADKKVDSAECSIPCSYYPPESCGGGGLWTVLTTTINSGKLIVNEPDSASSSLSTSTSPSSVAPTIEVSRVTVIPTQDVTLSATLGSSASSSSSSGSSNKAGIVAGVIVGLVALCAIVGGVYYVLRQRRRKALEKSHRRQSSINAFANAQRAPHMSVVSSQDSRLDPVLAARRQSDGSIADNVDFSRRVLKVTNPDDRW